MNKSHFPFLLFICLTASCAGTKDAPQPREGRQGNEPVSAKEIEAVRSYLGWECKEQYEYALEYLKAKGDVKVFGAFEAILSNPKDSAEVRHIFGVLRDLKGDRSRFIKYALHALTNPDDGIRYRAVELLGDIGSIGEASPLIALLSDDNERAVWSAATALVAIGGPREVMAIDIWLRGGSHRNDGDLRKHVRECRDKLEKRLEGSLAKSK